MGHGFASHGLGASRRVTPFVCVCVMDEIDVVPWVVTVRYMKLHLQFKRGDRDISYVTAERGNWNGGVVRDLAASFCTMFKDHRDNP